MNFLTIAKNEVGEITFISKEYYADPFDEIELNVTFTSPCNKKIIVPSFWAGKNIWKVRYSSSSIGIHKFETVCNVHDPGLNKQQGIVSVEEYKGNNSLIKHGRIQIEHNSRFFKHSDGTPFFWLADTWWYAFVKRFKWPDDYKLLIEDRVKKGFTVVQLIAGLLSEIEEFDDMGASEKGWPWEKGYTTINPEYFNLADKKIQTLIEASIVPCVVGSWGYYMVNMGISKIKKHWRYLIARWGSYPVAWCVAGETDMPPYIYLNSKSKSFAIRKQLRKNWSAVAKYIREIDPYNNVITTHPGIDSYSYSTRDVFKDESLFDFDMLQTGHMDRYSLKITLDKINIALSNKVIKPVINGEVCYEGICGSNWQDVQRFLFWSQILSGTAGISYGAEGIWSFKGRENFEALSAGFGGMKWKEAYKLPGSAQIGIGKKILEKYDWYKFKAHHEWVEPHYNEKDWTLPYAAGIPKKVRIIYFPSICFLNIDPNLSVDPVDYVYRYKTIKILDLSRNSSYKAFYINPRTGKKLKEMEVNVNKNNEWVISSSLLSSNPSLEDWLLVLEDT